MNDKPERKSQLPGPMQNSSGTSNPEQTYTLADLVAMFLRQDPASVEARVAAIPVRDLVASGARAAAERLLEDGVNIVGRAATFLRTARPEQRVLLAAVTDEFLGGAVTALDTLEPKNRAARRSKDTGTRRNKGVQATADTTLKTARALRGVVYDNVRTVVAGDAAHLARLDAAWGTSETAGSTADSLDAMVTVGRDVLKPQRPSKDATRDLDELFARATSAAEKVRAADTNRQAKVAEGATVSAAEVDRWGGIALWFIEQIVQVFRSARKLDPTVPRLPVLKLKTVLLRKGRKKAEKKAPAKDAPVNAGKPVLPIG
jgi:hypothetical protein